MVQDDGHIFCTLDQVHGEIDRLIGLVREVYSELGMDVVLFLSTAR